MEELFFKIVVWLTCFIFGHEYSREKVLEDGSMIYEHFNNCIRCNTPNKTCTGRGLQRCSNCLEDTETIQGRCALCWSPKNAGICEGCEHFVRMNNEHTYFIEYLICLSDDVLSLKPVEPHLPPQGGCMFFKSTQQKMHPTWGGLPASDSDLLT
jgi:hypothetical protein